jgi:hypothetical protein
LGGRFRSESLAAFRRNGWPLCLGFRMRALAFRIDFHSLTGIQRPFHADVRMHQRPSIFRGHDHSLCCSQCDRFCSALGSFKM